MSLRSKLEEYRALVQVVAIAQEKQLTPAEVVRHGVSGGVVHLFQDLQHPSQKQFLPSVKCISFFSECIADGTFAPTLFFTVENNVPRYSPICECLGKDLFTVVFLLFPDCFLGVDEDDCLDFDSESVSRTQSQRINLDENNASTPVSQKSNSNSQSASRGLYGSPPPPTSLLSNSIVSSPRHSRITEVNLPTLHRLRCQIAIDFLVLVDTSIRDIQWRSKKIELKQQHSPAPKRGEEESVKEPKKEITESAVLLNSMSWLLKVKLLTLSCIVASNSLYSTMTESTTDAGLSNSSRSAQKESWVVLQEFTTPVEEWKWPSSEEEMNQWYDEAVESLSASFSSSARTATDSPTLEEYLGSLQQLSQKDSALVTASHCSLLLHKSDFGKNAVALHGLPLQRPSLPLMPVLPGELRWLPCPTFQLATSPASFTSQLIELSKRRLSDAQLRTECQSLFATPFSDLEGPAKERVAGYLGNEENIAKLLDKNAVLLARVVIWIKKSADPVPAFVNALEEYVLMKTPFGVSVGQYLRELVSQSALSRERFGKWILHTCQGTETKTTSTHSKVIGAIIEFATVQCSWKLTEEELNAFATLRQTVV